jgi:phage-related protein
MSINAELQSLSPSTLLTFYTLDYTNLPGGSVMNFHAGTNELRQPVVWQGVTYEPMPIESEGFDVTTKGSMPRPKLRVANMNGALSPLVKQFDDFVGARVIRKRTFLKYLDAANFETRTVTTTGKNLLSSAYDLTTGGGWTGAGMYLVSNPGSYWGPPNDELKATSLIPSLNPEQHYVEKTVNVTAGERVTFSFWALPTAWFRFLRVRFMDGTGFDQERYAVYDFTGVSVVDQSSGVTATIEDTVDSPVDRGYKRVSLSAIADSSGTASIRIQFVDPYNFNDLNFANIASIWGFWVIGLQLQNGALSTFEEPSTVTVTTGGNPSADPNQHLADDLWFVERKLAENRQMIEFELSSAFDLMGQQLPNRQIIQNSCPWKYRGTECAYAGAAYDINNQPTANPANDVCAKTLTACRTRFTSVSQPVRFGGFPGAVRGAA